MPPDSGPGRLALFGATGDLAQRHLLPALAQLAHRSLLPVHFSVVGISPEPLGTAEWRQLTARSLEEHAAAVPVASRAALLNRLTHARVDLGTPVASARLTEVLGRDPVVAYLALPPVLYAPAVRLLHRADLPASSRVVVEKPFGTDLASARLLNELLDELVGEAAVYRADHFLFHDVVQDLVAARLAGTAPGLPWDRERVSRVDVVWEESRHVAGRAAFYDRTGALRDMVQSHLLQLLAVIAMEPPSRPDAESFRKARSTVLHHVVGPHGDEALSATVRSRYSAGSVGGRPVNGYAADPEVDPSHGTETYVGLRLHVDTPRWAGVPFVLRAGMAVGSPERRITLHRRIDDLPGDETAAEGAALVTVYAHAGRQQGLPPSARLLQEVLRGDRTFFVGRAEVEECWRVVDAVIAGWRSGQPPLGEYPAGGPAPAVRL